MPETSSTSCGCRSRAANACLIAARMPKSPQPGHQVDFWPPLKIFSSDTRHLPDAQGATDPNAPNVPFLVVDDRRDDLVRRDRPSVVLVDLAIRFAPGQAAQHVGELAGVVLLDDDHLADLVQLGRDAVLIE